MSLFGNQLTSFGNQVPFSSWRRDMNDLFDRFNRDIEFGQGVSGTITPNVEMMENDKSYHLSVEVPGMRESDLNISLKDNQLFIEGSRKAPSEAKAEEFFSTEFAYGDIYRIVGLANEVNPNTVKATCRDGILTVTLDKLEPSSHKAKKIPILKS
jgi:HSP20 family protein